MHKNKQTKPQGTTHKPFYWAVWRNEFSPALFLLQYVKPVAFETLKLLYIVKKKTTVI